MQKRIEVTISGEVQNVGFRYAARGKAQELGIMLRQALNMPDERTLRLVVEGDELLLQSFIAWAKVGPEFAKVERAEIREL